MKKDQWQTPICVEFHRTIELIGKRWTGAILALLISGPRRFSQILAAVPGLSDRLLTERLRELENEGIVTRTVFVEHPIRIEYGLSNAGKDLDQVIKTITSWRMKWFPENTKENVTESTRREKSNQVKPGTRALKKNVSAINQSGLDHKSAKTPSRATKRKHLKPR